MLIRAAEIQNIRREVHVVLVQLTAVLFAILGQLVQCVG